MLKDWTIHALSAASHPGDWSEAGRRLTAVLAVVERFGVPRRGLVRWRIDDHPVTRVVHDGARSVDDVVRAQRERHEGGGEVGGGASTGVVTGHLDDGMTVAEVTWELGGESDGDNVRVRFHAAAVDALDHQTLRGLIELLTGVGRAVDADRAQITTRDLFRQLGRRDVSLAVGALTLLPSGLPLDAVCPPGFSTVAAGADYPAGAVLIADLAQVRDDPGAVAEQLARVDTLLTDRAPRPMR